MAVIPHGNNLDATTNTTKKQVNTSQASTLTAEFTTTYCKDYCYFNLTYQHNGNLTVTR